MSQDLKDELPSLLDVVMNERQYDKHSAIIMRVTIVSELAESYQGNPADEYVKFFQKNHVADRVTGLLLIYPRYCQHTIELPTQYVSELLKLVFQQQQRNIFVKSCVLHSADITERLFNLYTASPLKLSNAKVAEYKTADPAEAVISQCITSNLKLSRLLTDQPRSAHASILENVIETTPDALASQGMLAYLLSLETVDTVEQYLARNTGPINVVLQNEVIWPLPIKLFPYN